jgi:DNA-binding NarL/FixJ family response regulator
VTIRVLLVDDQTLLRATFKMLIDSEPDLEVVGEAATGREAVEQVRARRPDVVLMDIRMPGLDGIEATREITRLGTPAKVLILTTYETDEYVTEALRAGATGFLGKTADPEEVVHGIRRAAQGRPLLSAVATEMLVEHFLATPDETTTAVDPRLEELTQRELQMVALAAEGLSNEQIGQRLNLAVLTVKTHVNRAMAKLGVHDRAGLVVLAYRSGLVNHLLG